MEGIHGAGKGDAYRPVDYKKWSDNWDAIFGKKKSKKKKGIKNGRSNDRAPDKQRRTDR